MILYFSQSCCCCFVALVIITVYRKDPHVSSFPMPNAAWDKYAIKMLTGSSSGELFVGFHAVVLSSAPES